MNITNHKDVAHVAQPSSGHWPLATSRWPLSASHSSRRGFTLVELMITIGIIAVLASMTALAVNGAMDAAKVAKTRSLIARLNALVMPRYESYRYRRLPISLQALLPNSNEVPLTRYQAAAVRCQALRQLMRMEMPDRWTDIIDDPVPLIVPTDPSTNNNLGGIQIQMPRPAISQAYLTAYNSLSSPDPFLDVQAKCLYLLVTMGLDDNDVMENFNVGDVQPGLNAVGQLDGSHYFVDAWNRPIRFLRWAPGFIEQPPLPSSRTTLRPPFSGVSQLQNGWDPDQTDPTGVYGSPAAQGAAPTTTNTYALYPLIFSAGPDGQFDIITDNGTVDNKNVPRFHYSQATPPNSPFGSVNNASFPSGPVGTPYPEALANVSLAHYDNIHNHMLANR